VTEECDGLTIHVPEATYLTESDARALGVGNAADLLEKEAGLSLSDGAFFGWPAGFVSISPAPVRGCERG
jgi:bifunctional pyridoxal-dependent enzyme with beta-cystathionase and maltose regulon repressor activities